MKIRTEIENVNGRYNSQVSTFGFTANEEAAMTAFGEPLIQVGGNIVGSVSRPGQTNTVLTVVGPRSVLAQLTPIILNGVIQGADVAQHGIGYLTGTTIDITGDGTGAQLAPLYGVFAANINAGGFNYLLNDVVTFGSGAATLRVAITGVDGSGTVTSFAIIDNGEFSDVVDSTGGVSMVTPSGHPGAGFKLEFLNGWGIAGATVVQSGTNYNTVPVNINITLPEATRRIRSDFPVKQVFDLQDSQDADIMAKVWAENIVDRLTDAKAALIEQASPFEGETVVTV